MRIRKNARLLDLILSSSAYPPEAIFQTTPHVCKLNQSPWDVLPSSTSSFPPPPPPPSNSTSSSYPTQNQLEGGEYSLSGNASIGDTICPVESVESMKVEMAAAKEEDAAPNLLTGLHIYKDSSPEMTKMCKKTNGKGWQCRKKESNKGGKVTSGGVRRRGRGPGKKAPSTSNPYEFYYYSGFGPLWGKTRVERNEKNIVGNMKDDSPSSSSQQIDRHNDEVEEAPVVQFMEDDDDSGGDDDNGRKRARKPVKARSLKSLM